VKLLGGERGKTYFNSVPGDDIDKVRGKERNKGGEEGRRTGLGIGVGNKNIAEKPYQADQTRSKGPLGEKNQREKQLSHITRSNKRKATYA